MSPREFVRHLLGRIVIFGYAVLAGVVGSYIVQEEQAQQEVRTECTRSWDCDTGQRIAPRPDTANMPNNDRPVERTP